MRHHETLGVAANATPEEIRAAYKKLAQMYHPDKHPGCTDAFLRIKAAHDALIAKHNSVGLFDDILDEIGKEVRRGR